ncbi:hypothetical protein F0U44_14495 [Nocardioides humilatus]|uniref:Uncharacterized protein n=1 Tax=Nocardioides humilatus TaxID=2607660 RepID=A0A5B1LB37_9ACTN|nr:hypothetical protein [Nocardioides humilatus]KAA1417855.1 hypothetical protein F0U44_14495 [Nocardioides humilatus]
MTDQARWVADPTIGWRILLTATLPEPAPVDADLTAATTDELRHDLALPDRRPILIGVAGSDLVVSAHHSAADGLGLLAVLERLGFGPATSSARGVGDRPAAHGYLGTVTRRLAEAAFHPPASLTPRSAVPAAIGDVMVEIEVAGSIRTAVLVHAAAHALAAHGADRHVAVAVGVTRDPAAGVDDRSALLRLRDVERMDPTDIERALREAPAERPPVSRSGPLDRAAAGAMRLLSRRLGSTLLVSHLGEVTAPHVDRLAFHPVTAGGTGISLGAVGHGGRTVVTLRARAADWDADGLEQVLEAVRGRLSES